MNDIVNSYLNYANDANINALKKIQSSYIEKSNEASTVLNRVDFSNWEDMISAKMSAHCNDMKNTYCAAIQRDIVEGNFATLISQIESLKAKCEEYKTYENAKYMKPKLPEEDERFYSKNQKYKMSIESQKEIAQYERDIKNREINLNNCYEEIKAIANTISNLTFNNEELKTDGITAEPTKIESTETESLYELISENEIAKYKDGFGATITVTETIEQVGDNYIRTLTETIDYGDGNPPIKNITRILRNINDPSVGTVETSDGERYSMERDPVTNEIIGTEMILGKDGTYKEWKGVVDETPMNFEMFDSNGNLINSKSVNASSELDFTEIWIDYQIELLNNGIGTEVGNGMLDLHMTGETVITNTMTGETVTLKLSSLE